MDIFLSAGDISGDNAAAHLVGALRKLRGDLTISGLGQERLKSLGQRQLTEGKRLAVMGFWEVARQSRYFQELLRTCQQDIEANRPQAVILVDYPGFNLRLARLIRTTGIPIVYYISPQVWAWGQRRTRLVKDLVDVMLIILPFEQEFYRGIGIDAHFVGHYLLEDIPSEYIGSDVPKGQENTLCVLPGSRPQEIQRMLRPMLKAARQFNRTYGTTAVVAGISNAFDYEWVLGAFRKDNIEVTYDDARSCLYRSALVLTASGTATLEAGIIGRPMVVVYRTGFLTYQIARRLISLDKIALVNLVMGEKVVPELLQREASPKNMVAALARLRDDRAYYQDVREKLLKVPTLLGGSGASDRAARLIVNYIERG